MIKFKAQFSEASAGAGGHGSGFGAAHGSDTAAPTGVQPLPPHAAITVPRFSLNHVAFPLGGIGAGVFYLEGTGRCRTSPFDRPDVFNEPCMFAALVVRGPESIARVLEGPVPGWCLV
jgi:hypothetical protein